MGITKLLPNGSTEARLKQCIIRPYPMVSENVDRHRSHGSTRQGTNLRTLEVIVEKGVDPVVCSFEIGREKAKHGPGTWEFTMVTPFRIRITILGASLRMFWKPTDIIIQNKHSLALYAILFFFEL